MTVTYSLVADSVRCLAEEEAWEVKKNNLNINRILSTIFLFYFYFYFIFNLLFFILFYFYFISIFVQDNNFFYIIFFLEKVFFIWINYIFSLWIIELYKNHNFGTHKYFIILFIKWFALLIQLFFNGLFILTKKRNFIYDDLIIY